MLGRYRGDRDRHRCRSGQPDQFRGRGALRAPRGRAVRRRGRPPRPVRRRPARGDLDGDVPLPPARGEHVRRLHRRDHPCHAQRRRPRPGHRRARPAAAPRPEGRQRPRGQLPADRHGQRPRHPAHGRHQRQAGLPLDHLRARHGPPRLRQLRPARPQGRARVHDQRPRHVDGDQQLPAHLGRRPARRRAGLAVRRHAAPLDVRDGLQRRPVLRDPRDARRLRPRPLLPAVAQAPPRARRRGAVRADRAGTRVVRREVRRAVPAGEVRPGLRARHGRRHGELGLRHVRRRPAVPQHADPLAAADAHLDPAARDGAHVVRRPGDDEVVERPVAQRGLRLVGRHLGGGRRHEVPRRLGDVPRGRQARGLPRRHGPGQPPHPRRRPGRVPGDGELRRDLLPEGPVGPEAAQRVRRRGGLPDRPAGLLPRARLGQHPPGGPHRRRRRRQR